MKIFNTSQIRELDAFTIKNEPILSIDLMERAAESAFRWIYRKYSKSSKRFLVLCGKGNNGGDGLVVARLLYTQGLPVQIAYLTSAKYTSDFSINLERAKELEGLSIVQIDTIKDLPEITEHTIIVDALLGTGIQGPVKGLYHEMIDHINHNSSETISIDIPSGLIPDRPLDGIAVKADHTLTFDSVKLGFLFPENHPYVGDFEVLPIGLNEEYKASLQTNHFLVKSDYVRSKIKKRHTYDHKGKFGHALMIHGSYGKMGASILSAKACLRSGIGLLTMHVPKCGYEIMQIAVPEAMVQIDEHERIFTGVRILDEYNVSAIGCGIGQNLLTYRGLSNVLDHLSAPTVFDADALNLMGAYPELLDKIPDHSILTPHLKEFSRLFGETKNSFERLDRQKQKSRDLNIYILLKGAHSILTTPHGQAFFNNTGNPGMATAGSGDVLTGVITALLGQGYDPEAAGLIGMHIHGLAGDVAADRLGHESLIAGDIIDHLGLAFNHYHQ